MSQFVPSKVVVMALKLDINQDTLWLKALPGMCARNMEFHLYRNMSSGKQKFTGLSRISKHSLTSLMALMGNLCMVSTTQS